MDNDKRYPIPNTLIIRSTAKYVWKKRERRHVSREKHKYFLSWGSHMCASFIIPHSVFVQYKSLYFENLLTVY